jgi:hypothetical protein
MRTATIIALLATTIGATRASAQEPRTEPAARAAAVKWLLEHKRIPDSTRVVATNDEAWTRFVKCDQPAERAGCSMIGGKSVTLVAVYLMKPDTALVSFAELYVTTSSCPGGRSARAFLTAGSTETFQIVYTRGSWGDMRPSLHAVC